MALLLPSSMVSSAAAASTDPVPTSTPENVSSQSTTPHTLQQQQHQGDLMEEEADEPKIDFLYNSHDSDIEDYIAKYNKYEADYVRRIKAKYFSKNAMNGGLIFDEKTKIDDETIKSSRWPCTKSFIEPIQSSEEQGSSSTSAAETSTNVSNKKYQCKKSN